MSSVPTKRRGRWSGLTFGLTLALACFAACLWWVVHEVQFLLANDQITASVSIEKALGSALAWQLAEFRRGSAADTRFAWARCLRRSRG